MGSIAYPFSLRPQTTSAGKSIPLTCGLTCRSRSMIHNASSWETSPAACSTSADPRAVDEPRKLFWVWLVQTLAIGVQSNASWPCGQDFQPKPECHQRRYAPRGERLGLLVLTAGPARTSTGVTPPDRWPRPNVSERSRSARCFLRASPRRTGRLDDHEADGTPFGSASARGADSRTGVTAGLSGNRRQTATAKRATGRAPTQRARTVRATPLPEMTPGHR
jgi:hypothetical protein